MPKDPAIHQPLFFQWGVSTLYGWGVYGLNLLLHWPKVAGAPAYYGGQIDLESFSAMDPLRLRAIAPALVESSQLKARNAPEMDHNTHFDGVLLHTAGNRPKFAPLLPRSGGRSARAIGAVIFFEDTIMPDVTEGCDELAMIVAGSSWCEEVLRANGVKNVTTVLQGVDLSLFSPAPRFGSLDGHFAIFSGGKLEHRKGQDLVILAFRAFAERHPEAILITAWHSPWPMAAASINGLPNIAPVIFTADGRVDSLGWAKANGIREEQFIDLGRVPNHQMARMLQEIDVAVFPNRCEGGTNLVAMESMACGVPTIVSNNTGHKDLVATGAPYVLMRQGAVSVPGAGTDGWGESDVDEIVETLERVWSNREEARLRGKAGADAMAGWSWRHQIGRLHQTLAPHCS